MVLWSFWYCCLWHSKWWAMVAAFGERASFYHSSISMFSAINIIQIEKESLLYLQIFSVSLFWTGAVLSNTVHVIVSGMVFLVLIHGGPAAATMPPKPVLKSIQYAVTTSFGSICYGSLFTAAIRTLRWEVCTFTSSCFSSFLFS